MVRAIIFDMDDTLIQTQQAKFAAHKFTAKHFYNLTFTDDHLRSHWGKPFRQMMLDAYQEIDSYENLLKNYLSVTHDFPISAYDGAHSCISHLADSYPLGLLTAANNDLVEIAMSEAGIPLEYFAYIQTSDDTSYHKPDPQVFSPALEYYGERGIDRSEILYVGDKLDDLQSARGAGIEFIAIAGHTTEAQIFSDAGGTHIEDFGTLIDLLS